MTRKQKRLAVIGAGLGVLVLAAALVLTALRDTIVFFYSPSEIAEMDIASGTRIRLGGLVEDGSVDRGSGKTVRFRVTDTGNTVTVVYTGVLPDLFREGQGVVVEGRLDGQGQFEADSVLAKHDENYMPREVADALKKQGHWEDDYAKQRGVTAQDGGAQSTGKQGTN
ncbi:MAG: cytochrome c maturation protein CcmE [Hyphomicrobiales bacterium]|nr:cytochrome c maturation protein CcmE [Hyphomicrobiales bacterium]